MDSVLVTGCDENYLDAAKALFSSTYFNGNWKGDYMLFHTGIPENELKWFMEKGILTKDCGRIIEKNINQYTPAVFLSFFLFKTEMKKWKQIVFLDPDIIVDASIEKLGKVKGMNAVQDPRKGNYMGKHLTETDPKLFAEMEKKFI